LFIEKLNKKQTGVYVIEEEKAVVNGIYEGYLDHDNVNHQTIYIYTEPKLTGEKVENYFISTPSETPWKTHLKVFSESEKIYISYETKGDQVEAEDINLLQDELVNEINRATEEEKKIDEKLDNKVDKTEGKGLSDENYTLAEKNKLAGIESGANKYVHPTKHNADMIVDNPNKRFVSDAEKTNWNDANSKKHTHSNKSILDIITQVLIDSWNSAVEHISDGIRHITIAERNKWNGKAEISDIPTKVGQLQNDKNYVTSDELGDAGYGDMTKGIYDKNNNGIVDDSERLNGKTLNEIKDELNEIKYVSTTSYDNVVSMPNGSINGQVSARLFGETRTNLIKGKNNDLEAWEGSLKAVENGYYKGVSKIQSLDDFGQNIPNVGGGKTYILSLVGKSTGTTGQNSFAVRLYNTDNSRGALYTIDFTNIPNDTRKFIKIPTLATTSRMVIFPYTVGSDGTLYFKDVLLEEGTDLKSYISNGTKSTLGAMKLKSVGKNLFDNKTNLISLPIATPYHTKIFYLQVKPHTQYTLSSDITQTATANIYFNGSSTATNGVWRGKSITQTSDSSGLLYIFFRYGNYTTGSETMEQFNTGIKDGTNFIQLEEGPTATPYEPYKESTAYVIAKDKDNKIVNLISLPNGIRDEIRPDGKGGYELVKRTKNYTLVESDIVEVKNVNPNIDRVRIKLLYDDYVNNGLYTRIDGIVRVPGYTEIISDVYINAENINEVKNMFTITNHHSMFFPVPIGTTLDEAKKLFVGTKLTYQLAEPEIIPIRWTGLQGYENGTIYFGTIIPEIGVYYNSGLQTHYPDHSIASIDKLYKVDKGTGLRTSLDVSKCVLAENKLSFTHPDLIDGDLVDWDYVPTTESTSGEKTVVATGNISSVVDRLLEDSAIQKENIRQVGSRIDNIPTKLSQLQGPITCGQLRGKV